MYIYTYLSLSLSLFLSFFFSLSVSLSLSLSLSILLPVLYVYMCMGCLRLVGSLKLQVSFAKEPYNRDDILQKRPMILRSLQVVATPYCELNSYLVWSQWYDLCKLQVCFAEYSLFYRALLQKRPMI